MPSESSQQDQGFALLTALPSPPRYIAICHPIRAQTMCTVSRAKRITALVWAGTAIYCLLWFFLVDINVGPRQHLECGYKVSRNLYLPIYLLDFALFFVTPLLVATVLYGLIGKVLFIGPVSPLATGATERWKDRSGRERNGVGASQASSHSRARGALSSRKQVRNLSSTPRGHCLFAPPQKSGGQAAGGLHSTY